MDREFLSDAAKKFAEDDFAKLTPEVVTEIAKFWQRHYLETGHKFLGRMLIKANLPQELVLK